MTILNRFKAALGILAGRDNTYFRSLFEMVGNGNALQIPSGMDSYIANAYEANAIVYSVVSYISGKAADVPLYVYQWEKDGKGPRIHNHPLEKWIYRPNSYFGKSQFYQQYYSFKLITGNTYIYFPILESGVNKGRFTEAWVCPANLMEIISGGWMMPVKEYRMNWGDQQLRYDPSEILHDLLPSFQFGYGREMYGMSPIQAARQVISKSNEAYKSQQKAMENMGVNVIVSADTGVDATFTAQQAQTLNDNWHKKYGNSSKRNTPAFTDAQIKVHQLGLSPVDLGIIADQQLTLRDICNIYHVPTEIFNDPDNKTNTNKMESRKAVYTDAVMPLVNQFIDSINRYIGDAWGKGIYIDADWSTIPELQYDRKLLSDVYSKGVEIGAYNRNEFRIKMGDEAKSDKAMSTHTVGMNVVPLDEVLTPEGGLTVDDYPNGEI